MILLDPRARLVVAHRGASGSYPENTLLAFREGLAAGAAALEFDVRVSADGVPVVMHDATVDRTTDGSGPVRNLPAAALRELDAGRREGVPSLEDVLDAFPDTPLIIEVKVEQAAAPVLRVLRTHDATGRVIIGSFRAAALAPFRRVSVPTVASRWESTWFWAMRRLPWRPRARFDGFSLPEFHRGRRVVDRALVRAAHGAGRPVHVWTVDDLAVAEGLWRIGVNGILTNQPSDIVRALSADGRPGSQSEHGP